MPSPFTIIQGKETRTPKKTLFLVDIISPDGDATYLTTAGYYNQDFITYNSNQYLARIAKNDVDAIQATGPQGYATVPSFRLTIADADKLIWTNHCYPHPWRGAQVKLTVILWDVVANQYSTDALQWVFIGGNPAHDWATGTTTLDVTSAINFVRMKLPNVPIEYRCPWDFPVTAADRSAALNDPTSIFFQCGYSADITGGMGNLQSGGAPFTTCDFTRSSPADPSVGCMARMGDATKTGVAPDGDLTHDKANNYTGTFGGHTWIAPSQYSGRAYLSGNKTFGFNQPNTALPGSYLNMVYGTQWVNCQALAPAGDPNSLRSECAVLFAAFGQANIQQLLVNNVMIPQNNSDVLMTWRYINPGGRNGALNGDAIFDRKGDPHGSQCVVEIVVPAQLAQPGSLPNVQALVTGPPILNVYAIDHVTSGVVTFTGPNWSCAGNPPFRVIIVNNSNPALNGSFNLSNWTGTTVTLTGSTDTGTGGACFFYQAPDLIDSGGDIVTNPSGQYANHSGPACNPAFALLDMMTWGNAKIAQIDPVSFYYSAQRCRLQIGYKAADGTTQTHAQFKSSFAIQGNQRQSIAQIMTAVRNSANLMIGQSTNGGLIQCYPKETLADQQPSVIPGSNDTTARTSIHYDQSAGSGYYAYLFDESNIDAKSFKIITDPIDSTPNVVSVQFQDEQNGYQSDSLTQIDPKSYAYSGNQEIQVPLPIIGAPNFDQNMRVANSALGETLWGNPSNNPAGTLHFQFNTNMRVLHLTGRLGYICGLSWQGLGIGPSAPQPIRITAIKPLDTDGERWQVKASWHDDEWYTYAYGQDPTPFQANPLLSAPNRPPYPWRPGVATWPSNDVLFPNANSFQFGVDTSSYPAQINISGYLPINTQPSTRPPLVPLQGLTSPTGGSLAPGTYFVAFSTNGTKGPVSNFVTVVVPTGTITNSITIPNLQWPSGAAPAIQPYLGTSAMNMRALAGSCYTAGGTLDPNGNPTSYSVTSISDGLPLPDINASELLVEEYGIEHGGVWGDGVISVASNVLTFAPPDNWPVNQWQNYVLSLYFRPGAAIQPALNLSVTSNTATTLTMSSTGFQAGDVVVMRAKAGHITSNTIGDDNFNNVYSVDEFSSPGLEVNAEVGNLIWVIAGTGAFQTPKVIQSNTHTVLTINGTWDVTPDATSIFVITGPTVVYTYTTKTFTNDGSAGLQAIASTPAINSQFLSLLVTVAMADSNGNTAPLQYQPMREVYVPPQSAISHAVTLSVSGTLAIGSDLAPRVILPTSSSTSAFRALLKNAPVGADLSLDVSYFNGTAWVVWMSLTVPAGTDSAAATQAQIRSAAVLPDNATIRLDVTGVGTTFPGSDLTVAIFY